MRNLLLLFFLAAAHLSFGQLLQVGEKLSYSVSYEAENYDFTVKVQKLSPEILFDFALSSSSGVYGTVNIQKKAQQSASKMHNRFSEDETLLNLKDEIAVFPSQIMIEALTNGKEIKIDAGNGAKLFKVGDSKNLEFTHFTFQENSVRESKITINATELVSSDKSEHIWISKDLGQALIVEMNIGWTIRLSSWLSAMPLTDKPQDMIGKAMSAPEMKPLMLRLAHSARINLEDLSDEDRPYVEREYFCPMEGIRIKTHNDTLTDILFYTEGFEHEGFTWRGYDGRFASGINLTMTYQQIDNTIGKPSTPRWPTDVLIQYPQQRMTVYYHMPNNDKDKKAIANAKIDFLEFE